MAYDDDRMLLARTLQAEAGNQGFDGMVAAGSVINNRVQKSGKPLSDVILADGQFSAWNGVTGYAGGEQGQDMSFQPGPEALEAADAILSGQVPDPTGGATHYYNADISDPDWGQRSGGEWTRIGDHLFGNAGGFNSTASNRAPGGQSQGGGEPYMQRPSQRPQQGQRNALAYMPPPEYRNVLDSEPFMLAQRKPLSERGLLPTRVRGSA
tara:strand:- start:4879 stop:5508 length:630 start_codon:yes stop_codon:yes gene_type:complete